MQKLSMLFCHYNVITESLVCYRFIIYTVRIYQKSALLLAKCDFPTLNVFKFTKSVKLKPCFFLYDKTKSFVTCWTQWIQKTKIQFNMLLPSVFSLKLVSCANAKLNLVFSVLIIHGNGNQHLHEMALLVASLIMNHIPLQ